MRVSSFVSVLAWTRHISRMYSRIKTRDREGEEREEQYDKHGWHTCLSMISLYIIYIVIYFCIWRGRKDEERGREKRKEPCRFCLSNDMYIFFFFPFPAMFLENPGTHGNITNRSPRLSHETDKPPGSCWQISAPARVRKSPSRNLFPSLLGYQCVWYTQYVCMYVGNLAA